MESISIDSLHRRTTPELVHMLRRMGADSPPGEARESLINRIWQFAPREFKPPVKLERPPVTALTEAQIRDALKVHLLAGMALEVTEAGWLIDWGGGRKESGTCYMPLSTLLRCALYLKPKDIA